MRTVGRNLNDWIAGYIKYTKDTEPPLSYHIWTAISCIASALQRRCFIEWGFDRIHPNLYVVIVGPSGMSRKSVAIKIGENLMDKVKIPRAAQAVTRERLVQAMEQHATSFTNHHGNIVFQTAVTVVSSELQVFLKQKDIDFLATLTDLWDCPNDWAYETKTSSSQHLENVCLNILGATAPDWLPSILPSEAVGGGFTSRVIFVVEEGKGKVVADPSMYQVNRELEEWLIEDLQDIHNMTGEYKFNDGAKDMYVKWYEEQEKDIKAGRPPIHDPKFGGYLSRRATTIKKLSMILSASRGSDLLIKEEDFTRANRLLETTEKKMPKAFSGLGKSKFAEQLNIVLSYVMHNHTIQRKSYRSEVLSNMSRDIDMWSLEQIEITLAAMKKIRVVHLTEEKDVRYDYIGPEIKSMKEATFGPEQEIANN